MAESIADLMHRSAAEMARVEWTLVEYLVGAFFEETGRFPRVVTDDQRWWCDGLMEFDPTPEALAHAKSVAAEYRKDTCIPASKAMLVREFNELMFTWRWEERK